MKPNQKPTTPINQDKIVQFTPPQPPAWMQQVYRLHKDGHKEFNEACIAAEVQAIFVGVRRDYSLEALLENMETLKRALLRLIDAIQGIEEAYNKAYCHKCDVVHFPMSMQGGAI